MPIEEYDFYTIANEIYIEIFAAKVHKTRGRIRQTNQA